MIFSSDKASATAITLDVAVFAEDAAGTLLLDSRRGCEFLGLARRTRGGAIR
jgi:hypothetical protein